jgi:predicted dehydrogenase
LKDIDGVFLATGDHQHAPLLPRVIKAGKDCYCEKPMAIKLHHAKAAYKAVKESKQVVQVGTQGVSDPNTYAAQAAVRSGVLGKITKVDIMANYWGPRWHGRPEVKQIKEEDTDWRAWLIDRPYRPFDPQLYFEYRIYRDFAAGIAGQWMCHNTAAVQTIMDVTFPKSVVARGGNYVWKDGREIWDTYHALVEYPGEFVFSYCCNHGSDYPWYHRYYGLNGTLEAVTGEFFPAYRITGVGGGNLPTPENVAQEKREAYSGTGFRVNRDRIREDKQLEPVGGTPGVNGNVRNWLECIRSRKTPHADILSGYAHSVTTIMCTESEATGKVVYWDAKRERITSEPPGA